MTFKCPKQAESAIKEKIETLSREMNVAIGRVNIANTFGGSTSANEFLHIELTPTLSSDNSINSDSAILNIHLKISGSAVHSDQAKKLIADFVEKKLKASINGELAAKPNFIDPVSQYVHHEKNQTGQKTGLAMDFESVGSADELTAYTKNFEKKLSTVFSDSKEVEGVVNQMLEANKSRSRNSGQQQPSSGDDDDFFDTYVKPQMKKSGRDNIDPEAVRARLKQRFENVKDVIIGKVVQLTVRGLEKQLDDDQVVAFVLDSNPVQNRTHQTDKSLTTLVRATLSEIRSPGS